MHLLSMFSGWRRTKFPEVGMCWADTEAMDTLAHAAGDYFYVE